MADRLTVWVRLHRLRENISRAEGNEWSMEPVKAFLAESGFIEQENGSWLCEEIRMGVLDKREYTFVRDDA